MVGFVITDSAAKMARRLGVVFDQRQADAMRRRVEEIEASIQREATRCRLPFRVIARRRLDDLRGQLSTSSTGPAMARLASVYWK